MPDSELAAKMDNFDARFVERLYFALDSLTLAIAEEKASSAWLVDADVIEVFNSLKSTLKTLSSGIYYESLPEGPIRQALFRRLKQVLDQLMEGEPSGDWPILKVSDAIDAVDFLSAMARMNSSIRPKSRRYLDWISERFANGVQQERPGGLIIP